MSAIRRVAPVAAPAIAVSVAAGAAVALGSRLAGPGSGVPLTVALAAVGFAIVIAVALVWPEAGLVMTLAYAASPLSFYILFRSTSPDSPYAATSDMAIDAAVSLGLAGAATVGALLRSWATGDRLVPSLPAPRPLVAIAAVLALTALTGAALGNPIRPLLADIVPFAELGLMAFLTAMLVDSRQTALVLLRVVAACLAVTAIVRLALYAQGPGSFGVEGIVLDGAARPRLFQAYPFGWVLPFALVCALAARDWRDRLGALGVVLLCGVMVVLSFERGLWLFAAIAALPVVVFGLRYRLKVTAPVLVGGLAALVVMGGLVGGGSGFTDPLTLIGKRLSYTGEQLKGRQAIQHKRQDEASAIWRTIRGHPAGWPLGQGLGAEYVGPTGIREGSYAASFRKKHYSFNWYLAMALRTGAVGLAVALWLVVALAAVGIGAFRRAGTPIARGTGLALASALLGLAVVAPIDPYLIAHPLALFLGTTVSLVALAARTPGQDDG
jgi:hypothetical protein